MAADYLLTGSCVGPESHRLERDGDGLKVYITVPTETPPLRFVPLSCRGLLGEYGIPLMGFEVGQTVSIWVNGTVRNLVVPAPGQVIGPNIPGAKPYRVEQLDRSELERSRALWAANAPRSYSFEFTVLGDWPGRVEPDWELAKTYKVSVWDGLVVSIVDLDTGESFPGKTYLSARLNGEFLQFGAFFDVLTTVGQSAKFDDTLAYPTEMVYRHEGFGTLSHMRVGNYQVITSAAVVDNPTSPTFDVRCISTKMAPGVVTAVAGKDPIPTGFDANNTGSCSFSWPVSAIRIRLWYGISDKSDNQTALIQFDEPIRDISFPLPDHVLVPIVKADLSQGPYLREVWTISLSGEATEIPGFSDVNLVTGPIPEEDRPVPVEKTAPTPSIKP